MIELRAVSWEQIAPWAVDYQKKSKNFEMFPDEAELVGIYRGQELIGYFITLIYQPDQGPKVLEINQGYLKPEARHKNLSRISMELLEVQAKKVGVQEIVLGTNRAAGSYIRFMHGMGYGISRAIFTKKVGN